MKKFATILSVLVCASYVEAQTPVQNPQQVSVSQYEQLKKQGNLSNGLYVLRRDQSAVPLRTVVQPPTNQTVPANCNCIIPIDATWSVVPFQFGTPPSYRNDDGSSPLINLPFNFCFYGQVQTQVYINNNGNVSFGSPYGTFSASAFPSNSYTMIAPFWSDVDTQNLLSGIVYYKITPTAMIVRWQTVGYYSQHVDKLNDYQLIITDGTDPLLPPGSNVSFCYGDMQWTTGDASGGVNGFGGTAATVGANMGDGINYIQIGTFDAPGTTYNGPFGPPSQVDWLDNKQFFLDACSTGGGGNLPPIMSAPQVCDTLTLCVGDTLPITAQFLSPENNQVTTATATASGTGLTIISSVPGNPAIFSAIFVGMPSNVGMNSVTLTGTDNGSPVESTSGKVIIKVIAGPTASFTSIGACPGSPMPFNSTSTPAGAPINGYHWDFGMPMLTNDTSNVDPTSYVYNTPGVYSVILTVTDTFGCKDTAMQNVNVYYLPQVQFNGGPTSGCEPVCVNFLDMSTVQNSNPAHWHWQYADGGSDTLQNPTHCFNTQGQYSVVLTVTSAQGCAYTDSIHNYINVIPGPQAAFTFSPSPASITDPTITFQDLSTAGPAEWNWTFGEGNASSTAENPTFVYGDTGTYHVMLIVSATGGACPDTAWGDVVIQPELLVWIPNAFTPNGDGKNDVFTPVFSDPAYVTGYELLIFDRWGNLLFTSQDPAKGWDGRMSNDPVQIDTYVYRVWVRGIDGNAQRFIGHVSLIR